MLFGENDFIGSFFWRNQRSFHCKAKNENNFVATRQKAASAICIVTTVSQVHQKLHEI